MVLPPRDESKSNEEQGLYAKYNITHADGTPVDYPTFTLAPDRDIAAMIALQVYASITEGELLSRDLEELTDLCRHTIDQGGDEDDRPSIIGLISRVRKIHTNVSGIISKLDLDKVPSHDPRRKEASHKVLYLRHLSETLYAMQGYWSVRRSNRPDES